jgi:hypothetical protein
MVTLAGEHHCGLRLAANRCTAALTAAEGFALLDMTSYGRAAVTASMCTLPKELDGRDYPGRKPLVSQKTHALRRPEMFRTSTHPAATASGM